MSVEFIVVSILPLLLLVLVPLIIVFAVRRKRGGLPSKRRVHPILRMVCGLLAFAIVAAVVVSTWRATSPPTDSDQLAGFLMPSATTNANEEDKEPKRVIFTAVAVVGSPSGYLPLGGRSEVIDWPIDRHRYVQIEGDLPGGEFSASVRLFELPGPGSYDMRPQGQLRITHALQGNNGSRGGAPPPYGKIDIVRIPINIMSHQRHPLSVVPSASLGNSELIILTHIAVADENEPVPVSAMEWVARHKEMEEADTMLDEFSTRFATDRAPHGVRMFLYAGPALWLLLLAAFLAAWIFPRPGLAFTVGIGMMVVLLSTLDRAMVERHAHRLADPELHASDRAWHQWRISGSFFHQARVHAINETTPPARQNK